MYIIYAYAHVDVCLYIYIYTSMQEIHPQKAWGQLNDPKT